MNQKKLVILGIITVLMITWAVVQSSISNRPRLKANTVSYLVQGLDPDDIGSIVIGTGTETVSFKRTGERFEVVNKDGYPAVSKEINALITSCLDIRTSEFYTDNPKNFKDLGVIEEDAEKVVKFLKPDASFLAGIIIGNRKKQGQGAFVRLVSDNRVYVALEIPNIKEDAVNYIDRKLFSFNRSDIASVMISSSGETYTLKEGDDSKSVTLENLPAGKKLKESESGSVFTALSNLRFKDVKKISSDNGLKFNRQFVCRLKDSTVYTLKIAQRDDNTYITCNAEFTDKTKVVKEDAVESEEELKKKESKLLAHDNAEEFQIKHSGWVYEINSYSAKNLVKELSNMLDDKEVANKEGDGGEEEGAEEEVKSSSLNETDIPE